MELIGGAQFKHTKNYSMFMYYSDWACSDWTLDVVFSVCNDCELFSSCIVSKEAEKHILT